ncbi:MAG TPA: hypothetical protein PLG04_06370, partial [Anaerolineaceae bacterium]|nr:hypothetical protein [Anaerolineaceae bacterium]
GEKCSAHATWGDAKTQARGQRASALNHRIFRTKPGIRRQAIRASATARAATPQPANIINGASLNASSRSSTFRELLILLRASQPRTHHPDANLPPSRRKPPPHALTSQPNSGHETQ